MRARRGVDVRRVCFISTVGQNESIRSGKGSFLRYRIRWRAGRMVTVTLCLSRHCVRGLDVMESKGLRGRFMV